MPELQFKGIRNWVKQAKGNAHHAPKSWDPLDRWLDALEKRVRELEANEEKIEELRGELDDAQEKAERAEGIEEALLDVGRGVRTFPEVLEQFDMDPGGIFTMPTPTVARNGANSGEIPLY